MIAAVAAAEVLIFGKYALKGIYYSASVNKAEVLHPDNAVAVSGVLREVGVVDRIPVFAVPGCLLAYNVKIDAELIHGRSEKLVHVENLRELVLYAVAVGLLGDRGNGFAQLDELLLQRQWYRWLMKREWPG